MATTDLKGWLEAFPREGVEQRIAELEAELIELYDAVKIHQKIGGGLGPEETPATPPVKPNKPEAISFILKEAGQPLTSGEIRGQMVERGWLEGGPKARKRFYSTMTRLKGEDRIVHRADGTYELPKEKGALSGLFE
ncbi:MAG TPA: hypothetical protein VFT19_13940 [Solirubrobacterales bacterium]|nr:hypothetical protein [Solirubrobacterales bacterium]